ncbi:MAG TPA: efflux RND transporter periplasmic adaptor subunit [Nitrospiraceae bacterium]|nr:efflux RND transporter periplasmic adaptor subunit [Nitrospiraceae bacterium]
MVAQEDVPLYGEWVGTTDGLVNATIQARVTGYLLRRNFEEGAFVRKGDLLFEIDPRPFQAALAEAKGQLSRAQALLVKTELDVKRDRPLAAAMAISQKELDDSIQAHESAKGSVASARASVLQAQLNLDFTRIEAPIDGVTGIAKAQVGDLVGPNSGALTSISTVDPIRVYFPISEQEYLKAASKVQAKYRAQARSQDDGLELILADGNLYPHKGSYLLVDRQVDVKTGTIRVAATFPNPGNLLRPGLFARVRAPTQTKKGAVLVPQRAVTELQGDYQVAVVGSDNRVDIRTVKVGERIGSRWIISEGIKPGEQVIVEGVQKVKAGMTVTPKSAESS